MNIEFDSNHQYLGVEFDWLATDQSGQFGYFSTAGFGPVPSRLCRDDNAKYELYEVVVGLDEVGKPKTYTGRKGSIHDWVEIAKRGFYAFDWISSRKTYEIVASPGTGPGSTLPDEIIQLLGLVVLPIDFQESQIFRP